MRQVDTTAPSSQQPAQQQAMVDSTPQVGLHPYMEHQPATNNANINPNPIISTPVNVAISSPSDSGNHPFYFYDTTLLYNPLELQEAEGENVIDFDSILSHYEWPEIALRKSLFTGHSMKVEHPQQERLDNQGIGWVFGTIVFAVLCIGIFLARTRLKLVEAVSSAFSLRSMARTLREHNIVKISTLIPGGLIYMIEFALLGFYFGGEHIASSLSTSAYTAYLIILAACMGGYLLRLGTISLLGNIFQNNAAIGLYNTTSFLLHLVGSVGMAPLLLLLYFYEPLSNIALWTALIFAAILFIIRLIRGLQLILTHSTNSRIYLFYYLCIVEIVPFLIAWKLIISS